MDDRLVESRRRIEFLVGSQAMDGADVSDADVAGRRRTRGRSMLPLWGGCVFFLTVSVVVGIVKHSFIAAVITWVGLCILTMLVLGILIIVVRKREQSRS